MSHPTQHRNKLSFFFSLVKRSLKGEEHDYTQGSIRQAIILLAIPMILELSLESVFAVVDIFFVIKRVFRGAVDAVMSMRSLWIASGIYIVLCLCLINGYDPFSELGLKCSAIVTTIGRGIGVLYQCYHLFGGKRIINIKMPHF